MHGAVTIHVPLGCKRRGGLGTPKVGTVGAASKWGGQKDENNTAAPKLGSLRKRLKGHFGTTTRFLQGEGRCSMGRNDPVHHRSHRGMGSGICRKILRDNVGKVRVAAGLTTTSKDFVPSRKRRTERSGDWRLGCRLRTDCEHRTQCRCRTVQSRAST
jgi:hypothetical protein